MGASRDMTLASLAEPAMLMAIFTLSMTANSTDLSVSIERLLHGGMVLRPSFLFSLLGLMLVAVAEIGRIPVDNPGTHLELTMIHEAMTLEYSGRHLALIEWAAQIKLMIFGVLIVNVFFPWGIATDFTPAALLTGFAAVAAKLLVLGAILGVVEITLAKMRLFRVPQFLNLAFLFALLGMFSHIILETGH
jgi:formate hydrogenlyase subunit 4